MLSCGTETEPTCQAPCGIVKGEQHLTQGFPSCCASQACRLGLELMSHAAKSTARYNEARSWPAFRGSPPTTKHTTRCCSFTPASMLLALEKGWLVRPRPFCSAQGHRARHAHGSNLLRSLAAVARDSQSGSKSRDSRDSMELLDSLLGSLDTGGWAHSGQICMPLLCCSLVSFLRLYVICVLVNCLCRRSRGSATQNQG